MTDSMNFGPEWLRNLSSDGSTSGGSTGGGGGSRPQLADYRYGREEMLTLFTKGLRPPCSLTNYPMLYANTAQGQLPLALTTGTEDERVGSVNLGSGWTLGSGSRGGGAGASISSIPGRGAGGGGRSILLVNSGGRGGGMGSRGGGRGGISGGSGWTTTNHNGSSVDATDWSPRKEYMGGGGSYRSQSVLTDNWRKGTRAEVATDEDGSAAVLLQQQQDGWRQGQQLRVEREPRWVRSTSWREGESTSAASSSTATNTSVSSHQLSRGPQQRRVWDEDHHQLPEWALEQVPEPGGATPVAGSFDATGAFHGENNATISTSNVLQKSTSQQNIGGGSKTTVPLTTSRSSISLVKDSGQQSGTGNNSSNIAQVSSDGNVNKDHPPDASNDKRLSDNAIKEKDLSIAEQNSAQHRNRDKGIPVQQLINGSVNGAALNKEDTFENSSSIKDSGINRDDEDFDRLQEDLVLKLVVDEEPTSNNDLGVRGARVGVGVVNNALRPPPPPPNLVLPAADKWFYQDPQGDLQGPFMARDMAEWYRAGYFSVALLVRRGCDERFFCLGDLVTLWQGSNPFQASPLIRQPPPLLLRDRDQLQQREQRESPVIGAPVVVNGSAVRATAGPAPMLPDHPDLLQLQILQQQIAYRQHTAAQHQQQQYSNSTVVPAVVQSNHRGSIVNTAPAHWASLTALQQRELVAQQLLQSQSHPHVHQQPPQAQPTNPLMHMISQMQQQSSKGTVPLMEQQVPMQAISAPLPLQQPSQPPTTQPLNPLEALIAQMGNLQQTTSQQPPLHVTETTQPQQSPPQQQATPSNPLLELLRMKQHQPSIQPTTQLEQLAMWQKNHQYSAAGVNLIQQQHLQHVQQQQWRTLQQPQTLQDQSVGLWDVSTSVAQTTSQIAPSTIGSVIHQQQQLSHHLSPSPPEQQLQQQIAPQVTSPQHQPSTLPGPLPLDLPIPAPQISREQQQQESVTTPGKKKKSSTEIISPAVDKSASKKDEEKQKKKEQNKKQDVEKKQPSILVDEKRKKEEDKAARNKEEKAKQRELEERKAKEQEQKRKSKEQRKLDEENRRKAEEQKRLEEIERERQAARDRDEQLRKQQQQLQLAQTQQEAQQQPKVLSLAPPAPWLLSVSNSISGNRTEQSASSPPPATNLADIQRAEREKRASEQQQQQQIALASAAALYQQQQMQMQLEQQQADTKTSFSWASKPLKPSKVKSLAEIQAEEHELFLKKQAEEQRLATIKEKEAAAVPTAGIWSGQSLTWATENITANNIGGFWDDSPRSQKQQIGAQQVGNRVLSGTNVQQTAKQTHSTVKPLIAGNQIGILKKIQQPVKKDITAGKNNNNNNNDSTDEFSNWCSKMLANMNANVDVPTFIGFLRDIESAFDVREYCRDYLGDSNATQQFASQFVEKRRLFKPNRSVTHKDDMCAPAPALTPNHHAGGVAAITATANATATISYTANLRDHSVGNNLISTDFQEVKVKGKKVKKSKMLKVDSRILGFSVTAAPDRFNVGDRDYGDTT